MENNIFHALPATLSVELVPVRTSDRFRNGWFRNEVGGQNPVCFRENLTKINAVVAVSTGKGIRDILRNQVMKFYRHICGK